MDRAAAISTLSALSLPNAAEAVSEIEEGATSLLRTETGVQIALLRRQDKYDTLILGTQSDCPVPSLRAVLETAVLPLSERYAASIGVAVPERDAVRKRIREASVALDVISKGRHFSVAPLDIRFNPIVRQYLGDKATGQGELPEQLYTDNSFLNQIHNLVVSWNKEVDRVVQAAKEGPGSVLSVEEETVFWSSLDAALAGAQEKFATEHVKLVLDVLARNRRATGFLQNVSTAIDDARRKAATVLTLIQGLPIIVLRTADDLDALKAGVTDLLTHVAGKLRVSVISVERVLSLVDSMGTDVSRSVGRILSRKGALLSIPFEEFVDIFHACCEIFECWSMGYDHCRRVAREAARKKGESIPPRQKSPLSQLHRHFTSIYELRADFEDLHAVFVMLSKEAPNAQLTVELLDASYATLVKQSESFDHFDIRTTLGPAWTEMKTSYCTQLARVEASASSAYQSVIENESSTTSIARSLQPFGRVVDKHFMCSAVADAVPLILSLGKKELLSLGRWDDSVRKGEFVNRSGDTPNICVALADYQTLQRRATRLTKFIEECVGATQMNLNPDIQDFNADVQRLQERADPAQHLLSWLRSVNLNLYNSNFFKITESGRGARTLALTICPEQALFFKLVQLVRNDARLGGQLSEKHLELSRSCKYHFRDYCNLRDAIFFFNNVDQLLVGLDKAKGSRIIPCFASLQRELQALVVDGLGFKWSQPSSMFSAYLSELNTKCRSLLRYLHFLLEQDTELERLTKEFESMEPVFHNGKISEETTSLLKESMRRFLCTLDTVKSSGLGPREGKSRFEAQWVESLNTSLRWVFVKFSRGWIDALKSRNLSLPTVVFDVVHRSSSMSTLGCFPSIWEIEQQLLKSIGEVYSSVLKTVSESCKERRNNLSEPVLVVVESAFSSFLKMEERRNEREDVMSPYVAIREATEQILVKVNQWCSCAGYRDVSLRNILLDESSLTDLPEVLSLLSSTYEVVTGLLNEKELPDDEKGWIHVDPSELGRDIAGNILANLNLISNRGASIAAEVSQRIYGMISDAQTAIREATGLDSTEMLASLQKLKEDTIPSCEATARVLTRLEMKYNEIADNIQDDSFSTVQSSETWILSEELFANLKRLQEVFEQRMRSLLVNRDILVKKYEERERAYHKDMAVLFAEFQTLRCNDEQADAFLESAPILSELESKVCELGDEGRKIVRVGTALGISTALDTNGPENILIELRKVRMGIQELISINDDISGLADQVLKDISPENVRRKLFEWAGQAEEISRSSGAQREAKLLHSRISELLEVNPLISEMHAVNLSAQRERDVIRRLFGITSQEREIKAIRLGAFWGSGILQHTKYLREVLDNAAGENAIAEYINSVEVSWVCRKSSFVVQHGVAILTGIPGLLDELEEHIQGLETMRASRHARLFESERAGWESRLSNCRESLELLSSVQSRWSHLRNLFGGSKDTATSGLRTELREEFSMFSSVHARFEALGKRMQSAPGLLEGLDGPLGLADMEKELSSVVRGLSSYLERQRSLFPRFFFLSDSDLLHVLSIVSSEIEAITPHVAKIFPGFSSLCFSREGNNIKILGGLSAEGERIMYDEPVRLSEKEPPVVWLRKVERDTSRSLRKSLAPALRLVASWYGENREGESDSRLVDMTTFSQIPAQVALLAMKICFTQSVEACISRSNGAGDRLRDLISIVEGILSDQRCCANFDGCDDEKKLSLLRNQFIKELLYQRQLLLHFTKVALKRLSSCFWIHELRFYCSKAQNEDAVEVTIRCGQSSFLYGWEYLGVGETLVQTTLTSRCFLILADALRRGLGGSPFGPAGTGKTETVKALGRYLGRFVAVFNCDESFDSVAVGRILAGACRIGCWVCFDEFNRLSASILSATSGQLALLQSSIRNNETSVANFYQGDLRISIKQGVGVFVTMNPTYSGRRDLPANLKSLFRPCAMSKPDAQVIAEVLLLTHGFQSSLAASYKLVSLLDNLKRILTDKPHYDFGLRSLKSIVSAASSMLICEKKSSGDKQESRNEAIFEEDLLVRALGEVVKPKLDAEDLPAYENSMGVVFTKATSFSSQLPTDVEEALRDIMVEEKLESDAVFLEKVAQLFSLIQHQSGIILVGPTGSGKSTTWKSLHAALKKTAVRSSFRSLDGSAQASSSVTVLDAKLLSTRQLYGYLDPITREWSDGLFAKFLRNLSVTRDDNDANNAHSLHWLVFDGDIDPDWVENLNSVLDDNKILTLPSGEQIPLLPNTRILFETDSLEHANPSTISRCGMVCFGEPTFACRAFMKSLRSIVEISMENEDSRILDEMARVVVEVASDVAKTKDLVIRVPLQSILASILRIFRQLLLKGVHVPEFDEKGLPDAVPPLTAYYCIRLFIVTSVKCITAGMTQKDQCSTSQDLMKRLLKLKQVEKSFSGRELCENLSEVTIAPDGNMQEYSRLTPENDFELRSEDLASPDIVIQTPTTMQTESLLRESLALDSDTAPSISPVILCGPPGCGKSMLLTAVLRKTTNVSLVTLSFSSETSPEDIIAALRGHTMLTKRANGSLRLHPKVMGCKVVLFCDEVNLERPDMYGTQHTIQFLRGLVRHQGFWQGTPPVWVSVEGITVVAACNPEEDAGRYSLSLRFLSACTVIRIELPNKRDLRVIYEVFVRSLLRGVHSDLLEKADSLTAAMVDFFILNKERFSPASGNTIEPHYVYSPRDLTRWIRGMKKLMEVNSSSCIVGGFEDKTLVRALWSEVVSTFCYEARRVFGDRLLRDSERDYVEKTLVAIVHKHLESDEVPPANSLYTTWLPGPEINDESPKCFGLVRDVERFRAMMYQKLRVFAEEEGLGGSWMNSGTSNSDTSHTMIDQFAVTNDVLDHATRLERVLCQPLGHAVLIGAPGTGKKTLARFAAWMLSIEIHQVYSHSAYSEVDFANDLRLILRKTGVRDRQIMIIFDESNAMDSGFLEMMNSILACGDVPGLFAGDDRLRLIEELKQRGLANGSSIENEQTMYADFVKRVRNNLHIVFTISTSCPGGNATPGSMQKVQLSKNISERSPALYNRCTVDWFGDWTKETLEAVADLKIEVSLGHEKDEIIKSAVRIHEVARKHLTDGGVLPGVTPRHYLEFIEQLNRIALEKGNSIAKGVDRHTEALRRLRSAGDAVDALKEELSSKAAFLQQKEKHAGETLQDMVGEQRLAEKAKVDAEQLAKAAQEASEKAQIRAEEVADQLAEVSPKVEAAKEAVGKIRKEFLEELRAMPNPPSGVRIALDGVMMVLDTESKGRKSETQYSWSTIRRRMRSSDFIPSVVNFVARKLSTETRTLIEKRILQNPNFDVQKISYASRAAGPLAEWTMSVLDYAAVAEALEPLQKEIIDLQNEQEELVARQEDALQQVSHLEDRIESCRKRYAELVSEAERIRQEIMDAERNVQRSEEMLDSLANEWDRWVRELNDFNSAAVDVWGNSLCGAAFVAYAGPVDGVARSAMFGDWMGVLRGEGVPFDENIKPYEFLSSAEERGLWSSFGLPTDPHSVENYAILNRSARFPLVVSPNGNTASLLRKVLARFGESAAAGSSGGEQKVAEPRITQSSFSASGKKSFMRALESAIRFGTIIVLEDTEKFDKVVSPLLGQESSYGDVPESRDEVFPQNFSAKGSGRAEDRHRRNVSQRFVRLGARDVLLNPSFRMFLASSDAKSVPAAAITRSNVVSFELSKAALRSCCVTKAIQILSPELEERRKSSLTAKLDLSQRKRDLEQNVLEAITNVKDIGTELLNGSLLDDLTRLKGEVELLERRNRDVMEASEELTAIQVSLEPVGETAVDAFEVLRSLSALHPLYSFDVSLFLGVFDEAIKACQDLGISSHPNEVQKYQRAIVKNTFSMVAASLFPRDRLPFAAALSLVSLTSLTSDCNENIGNALKDVFACMKASQRHHANYAPLDKHERISLLRKLPQWLYEKFETVQANMNSANDPLDKILAILSCALGEPYRLTGAIDKLACEIPGSEEVVHGKQTSSEGALFQALKKFASREISEDERSDGAESPLLLCAIGETTDTSALVAQYCTELKLFVMNATVGSTQSSDWASNMVTHAMRQSSRRRVVMFLKNAHLGTKESMESLRSEIANNNGKLSILLVIAAEISRTKSVSSLRPILPFCRKLAFEAQPSFRANFSSSLDKVSSAIIRNSVSLNERSGLEKLIVISSWLHASLLERARNSPTGFSKTYEFSDGDLDASWEMATLIVSESENIGESLADVGHTLTTSVYGCRMEENTDVDIVRALVQALYKWEKLGSENRETVSVFHGDVCIAVPLCKEERDKYIRSMPLVMPPQWCYMPSRTTSQRQVFEGKIAFDVLLKLVQPKLSLTHGHQETVSSGTRTLSTTQIQLLTECHAVLDSLGCVAMTQDGSDPLEVYIAMESALLDYIVREVDADIRAVLGLDESVSKNRIARTQQLERELLSEDGDSGRLPSIWSSLCRSFPGRVSLKDFASKLKDILHALSELAHHDLHGAPVINMSAVLRPSALLEALKFAEAKRREVPPHRVYLGVCGKRHGKGRMSVLRGVELQGGKWDVGERVFVADGEAIENYLYVDWHVANEETWVVDNASIELPLYWCGVERMKIGMVRVPVRDNSLEQWRLCGACLTVT